MAGGEQAIWPLFDGVVRFFEFPQSDMNTAKPSSY